MRALAAQLTRFGLVGIVGFVVDFTVFNILRATVLSPDAVHHGLLWANVISTSLAIITNWVGNRYWTFNSAKRSNWVREAVEFVVVSLGGLAITLVCLWVSHYVLGYTSLLADNIAKNVVGLGLGTAFRFTFYRLWVFRGHRMPPGPLDPPADESDLADAPVDRLV
jgi:putative flippase GtrA